MVNKTLRRTVEPTNMVCEIFPAKLGGNEYCTRPAEIIVVENGMILLACQQHGDVWR